MRRKGLIFLFVILMMLLYWQWADVPTESQHKAVTGIVVENGETESEDVSAGLSEQFQDKSMSQELKAKQNLAAWIERGEIDKLTNFIDSQSVDTIDELGYPLLTEAYRMGQPEFAELLIKKGADINQRDFEGGTPLHHAVNFGDESSIRYLLQSGAKVNLPNELGQTPLHMAVDLGSVEIVKMLLKWGASPSAGGDKEALPVFLTAVVSGYPKIIDALIDHDESLKQVRDKQGRDAIVLALSVGNVELAEKLKDLGVPTEL